MTKSTDDWLASQLDWQRKEKPSAVASPKTRRYLSWRMRRAKPSAPASPGCATDTAKLDLSQNTEQARPRTGRGG